MTSRVAPRRRPHHEELHRRPSWSSALRSRTGGPPRAGRRDQDRGVGHAGAPAAGPRRRPDDRRGPRRARLRRGASAKVLDEHPELGEERELARRLDARLFGPVCARPEDGRRARPSRRQARRRPPRTASSTRRFALRRARETSNAATTAWPSAAEARRGRPSTIWETAERGAGPTEHLQRDREVVRREHPDGVDVVVRDPPADARGDDSVRPSPSRPSRRSRPARAPRVIAPLVHHEERPGALAASRAATPASSVSGFSLKTGTPRSSSSSMTSACVLVVVATTTPSAAGATPRRNDRRRPALRRARPMTRSERATTGTSQPRVPRSRRMWRPHRPQPTRPMTTRAPRKARAEADEEGLEGERGVQVELLERAPRLPRDLRVATARRRAPARRPCAARRAGRRYSADSAPAATTTRSRYHASSASSPASSSSRSAPRPARRTRCSASRAARSSPSIGACSLSRASWPARRPRRAARRRRPPGRGRHRVDGARGRDEHLPSSGRVGVEQAARAVEPPGGRASKAHGPLSRSRSGRLRADPLTHRALREPAERHELAAGEDRRRQRAELARDEHDRRVWRRLLQILEQRVRGVLVHPVRVEHEVDAPLALERPHVQVVPERAQCRRCGSSRRAARAGRGRGACAPRRAARRRAAPPRRQKNVPAASAPLMTQLCDAVESGEATATCSAPC